MVYPWFAAASAAGSAEKTAERLARPPWYDRHPELGPRLVPFPPELAAILAPPLRWSFFGRSFASGLSDPACGSVYLVSLADQVARAHETGRLTRALELAEKLAALHPAEESDALLLESLRLLGRKELAASFLASLSPERATGPAVLAVRALIARDRGDAAFAERAASAIAPFFPGTLLAREADRPAAWPRTFAALTRPLEPPHPVRQGGAGPR